MPLSKTRFKFIAIFSALFALAITTSFASAVCICAGSHESQACKQCGAATSSGSVQYTVEAGQLLSDVARTCGVDEQTIIQANNLPQDAVLSTGQTLQVPGGRCGSYAFSGNGGSSSALGEGFLKYWLPIIGGRQYPLPSRCYDSTTNTLLQKYMQQNGLYQRGFDRALVLSLIAIESSCNHNTNNGGLMQVDSPCLFGGGCTLEQNIDLGTRELAGNYDSARAMGVSDQNVLATFIFFGYNRGAATERIAISKYSSGTELHQAMVEACYQTNPCSKGRSQKWCCDEFGRGAGYPEKIATYYAPSASDSRLKP